MSFLQALSGRTQPQRDGYARIQGSQEEQSVVIMKPFFVYILASKRNGTLYIGMTNDLIRRTLEHKNDLIPGFSKKHKTHLLVFYEIFHDPENAILREKQLKRWKRLWKIKLIEQINPEWNDLFDEIGSPGSLRAQG
jgi:putative endonuclease